MSRESLSRDSLDKDTAIFVPNSWDDGEDGGRVTTPRELETFRPVDGHAVDEMMELAVEIQSEDHLRDLCDEHFESAPYSLFAMVGEYRDRASDEKLLEDARSELRMAYRMARGNAPAEIDGADLQTLERLWRYLRDDLDEAESHLSRAKSFQDSVG